MRRDDTASSGNALYKPMDIKKMARVPYATVIGWLTVVMPAGPHPH